MERVHHTHIGFRPLTRDDFDLLVSWLEEPAVRYWWNHETTSEALEDDFGESIDGKEGSENHVVLLDGEPVGVIQYSRFSAFPDYVEEMAAVYPVGPTAASIDYMIGRTAMIGRGLGTEMLRAFVERVWTADPEVTEIVVPVNSANERSWRALQRIGFRPVARGEMEPDSPDHGRMHEILRIDRPDSGSVPPTS